MEILDIGEKWFLFRFFHWMDMEQVIKGASRTFNNHLLVFHKLTKGEDSLKVPLIFVSFLVQIHDVPPWFIGCYLEYDCESLAKGQGSFMRSGFSWTLSSL